MSFIFKLEYFCFLFNDIKSFCKGKFDCSIPKVCIHLKKKLCVRIIILKYKSRPFKHVVLLLHIVVDSDCRWGLGGIWYQYCRYWQGVMKYVERCLSPFRGRDVATDVKQPQPPRAPRSERGQKRPRRWQDSTLDYPESVCHWKTSN